MKRSWIQWMAVCSLVGTPAWAGVQERERPAQDRPAPAGRPAQDRPPKPPEPRPQDKPQPKPQERPQDKPEARPQERPQDQPQAEQQDAEKRRRLDDAMRQLRAKEGRATKEDLAAFRKVLTESADAPASPRAATRRERLNVALNDLEKRAENAQLQKEDVTALEARIIDMRLENAIDNLEAKSKQGTLDREDFERAKGLLQQHADLVKSQGDAEAMAFQTNLHQELAAAVDDLEQRAAAGLKPEDFTKMRQTLAERRLDTSLSSLERNALAKRATDADYAAVRDALADRGELAGDSPDAQAIQQRYLNALQGLEQKAKSGQITREEFAQLRTQLQQKAREASAGK